MEASSSTSQQNNPQGNTNDQVSDDVNALTLSSTEEFKLLMEMENRLNSRQGNINDQVSIDVTALKSSLKEEFKQLHPVSRERCIYKVPKRLKELNEKAYTPRCVSIGPYHHGKEELKAMEEHKTMYLQHFLRYTNERLETFISWVRNNETRLRNCYQERIDLSSEKFVRLMLVDAVFVIMVMFKGKFYRLCNEDELLFNKPWMVDDIRNDMILLENQLPFFILDHFLVLSNLVLGTFSMVELSSHFLNARYASWMVNRSEGLNFSKCKHLVEFLRIGQQPLKPNKLKALEVVNLPSALELYRAGVKFKRAKSLKLVDINFNFRKGILEIPLLQLEDSTEILFRNIQAFEQRHIYSGERYLNDYICMINLLITNEKDVEILTKEKIIENCLQDNEQVVHLLHNLSKEDCINTDEFYFTDVVNDLNEYCSKRRNRWRANLTQNYFHSPWAILSVIAAVYIILLTTIQTICSILQAMQQQ